MDQLKQLWHKLCPEDIEYFLYIYNVNKEGLDMSNLAKLYKQLFKKGKQNDTKTEPSR